MHEASSKTIIFFNFIIVNAASFVEKITFFIANIIIARYLSVEHFGEYSTALAYATLFTLLTDVGINTTLVRALNLESDPQESHFTSAFSLKLILSIVMYSLMALTLLFTGYNHNVINLTLILGVVRVGNELIRTFYAVDEARQKFLFPSVINSLYVKLFLLGTIAVIVYRGDYYDLCIVRLVIVYIFVAYLAVYVFRKFKFRFTRKHFINFCRSIIPFTAITILWNLPFRTNATFISLLSGTKEVGIFTNSILFIDTISILQNNLYRIIAPVLYTGMKNNDRNKFQFAFTTLSKFFNILSFYLLLVFLLFAKEIILVVFGQKYFNSIEALKILSFSIPLLFNMATIIIVGLDKQKILSKILLISSIVNVVCNIVLIKIFDIYGAAITVVLTYGVIYAMSHFYLYKNENMHFYEIVKFIVFLAGIDVVSYSIYHIIELDAITGYYSFFIVSFFYMMTVMVVLIRKDDIRIIKEILKIENN